MWAGNGFREQSFSALLCAHMYLHQDSRHDSSGNEFPSPSVSQTIQYANSPWKLGLEWKDYSNWLFPWSEMECVGAGLAPRSSAGTGTQEGMGYTIPPWQSAWGCGKCEGAWPCAEPSSPPSPVHHEVTSVNLVPVPSPVWFH